MVHSYCTNQRMRYGPGSSRERHDDFVAAYNFARRLKTLKGLTPFEFVSKCWTRPIQTQPTPSNAGTEHLTPCPPQICSVACGAVNGTTSPTLTFILSSLVSCKHFLFEFLTAVQASKFCTFRHVFHSSAFTKIRPQNLRSCFRGKLLFVRPSPSKGKSGRLNVHLILVGIHR
jgi:hypothetical protein